MYRKGPCQHDVEWSCNLEDLDVTAKGCCERCDGLHEWKYDQKAVFKLHRKVEDEEIAKHEWYRKMKEEDKRGCPYHKSKRQFRKEHCKCEEIYEVA